MTARIAGFFESFDSDNAVAPEGYSSDNTVNKHADSILTEAAALLHKKGAKKVLACVSHAILNDLAIQRLRKSNIDELITTDTVLRPAMDGVKSTTLSVAGLLGEAIRRIRGNLSVTSLFESKGGRAK